MNPRYKGLSLSAADFADIQRRRDEHQSWATIAAAYGASVAGIRRNVEPEYRAACNARCRRHAVGTYTKVFGGEGRRGYVQPEAPPPPEVLRERSTRMSARRSLTAIICGDPEPGRSALDRRAAYRGAIITLAGGAS